MSHSKKDKPGGHRMRLVAAPALKQAGRENRRAMERQRLDAIRTGHADPEAVVLPTSNAEVANPWDWD